MHIQTFHSDEHEMQSAAKAHTDNDTLDGSVRREIALFAEILQQFH